MRLNEIDTTLTLVITDDSGNRNEYVFNSVEIMDYLDPYRLAYAKAEDKPTPDLDTHLKQILGLYLKDNFPQTTFSTAQIEQIFIGTIGAYALYKKKLNSSLESHFGTEPTFKRLTIPRWKYFIISWIAYCLNLKTTLDEVLETSPPKKSSTSFSNSQVASQPQ